MSVDGGDAAGVDGWDDDTLDAEFDDGFAAGAATMACTCGARHDDGCPQSSDDRPWWWRWAST